MKKIKRLCQGLALAGGGLALPLLAQTEAEQQTLDWALLEQYCMDCHNYEDQAGSIAFDILPRDSLLGDAHTWELAIRKIRTGMMPPAGKPRPPGRTLDGFALALGRQLDSQHALTANPGNEGMGRLNRAEYRNAIRDLLAFDASEMVDKLPREAEGEGFDNNVALLSVSPTLIDAYASAAMRISREAVGDLSLLPSQVEYPLPSGGQDGQVEGLPLGTRGGMLVTHNFPLDGQYEFIVNARGAGGVFDNQAFCSGGAEVVVTLDGEVLQLDETARFQLPIAAGPHEVGVALLDTRRCEGVNDFFDVYSSVGGISGIEINGPFEASGAGDTPSRRAIFSCYPAAPSEARGCAQEILGRLASLAYRQPLDSQGGEVGELLSFFDKGQAAGGFEMGIQYALSRLLVDPRFLFQIETQPAGLSAGETYAISDLELASRLSFFLWSSLPDQALLDLAAAGELKQPAVLKEQVLRMLRDPKADALVQNFAGQWLRLRDLDTALPQDAAFNARLRAAFRSETELLFNDLIRLDLGLLHLLDADYSWLNESLAKHYGISGVRGDYLRRVELPEDSPRRGILGHGSILTATSVANRTSPVIRGAWIVEEIMGAPVPVPPPGVETDLSEESAPEGQAANTLRERLELHRANPVCSSCHNVMDPIGLALENFDLVGRWRDSENGFPLNTRTELADGTHIDGPATLRRALLERGDVVAATVIEKLLAYALGRELEPEDMPAVRAIAATSAPLDYRFSEVVLAIVNSQPFQLKVATAGPVMAAASKEGTQP